MFKTQSIVAVFIEVWQPANELVAQFLVEPDSGYIGSAYFQVYALSGSRNRFRFYGLNQGLRDTLSTRGYVGDKRI